MSELIKRLYPKRADVGRIWSRFRFLHPEFLVFSHPEYQLHSYLFSQQIKNTFFPTSLSLGEVEEEFYKAANRGICVLNSLVNRNCSDLADLLCIKEIASPPNLQRFIESARDLVVDGEKDKDQKMAKLVAYKKMQTLELGYRVLMIDTDREVQASLRHYTHLVHWFDYILSTLPGEMGKETFQPWSTSADVTLYGTTARAFRSRVKYLNDQGRIKYGSILMKMLQKTAFASSFKDNTGVEFIVAIEEDRRRLVQYFREIRVIPRLEDFEERKFGAGSDNPSSSNDFCCTKFIVRIPTPQGLIAGHPLGTRICGRIPTEVQIITLDDYYRKERSETASHEEYKRRQFLRLFPCLFPKRIYAPFLQL